MIKEVPDDAVVLEFWPAPAELQMSKKIEAYLGNLTDFYGSVDNLKADLKTNDVEYERWTDDTMEEGLPTARAFPPEIIALLLLLGPGGLGLVLYKLLRLWVDLINGRKIKVVVDNIEIDATQLTEKQFHRLFEKIYELKQRQNFVIDDPNTQIEWVASEFRAAGFPVQPTWAASREGELQEIRKHVKR
jgi:hypothetical protein